MADFSAKVTVRRRGRNAREWIEDISSGRTHFEIQERILTLSHDTARRMRETITHSLKRLGSTGRLESKINAEILDTVAGISVGIGKISELPPYWEILNSGLTASGQQFVPPKNLGFFASGLGQSGIQGSPVPGGAGEQWVHTGAKSDFLMTPTKAIEPTKYIDISAAELARSIKLEIRRIRDSYVKAARG